MKSKNDMRIKRKLGALTVLGLFMLLVIAGPVAATDFVTGDGGYVGIDDDDGRIVFHEQGTTDEIEIATARLGIGDTSPDFKLEVTGSSGSGYFGVTSSSDGDIFIIDSNGKVGIGIATPAAALDVRTGVTGSGGSAKGVNFEQTLTASAHGDDLTWISV